MVRVRGGWGIKPSLRLQTLANARCAGRGACINAMKGGSNRTECRCASPMPAARHHTVARRPVVAVAPMESLALPCASGTLTTAVARPGKRVDPCHAHAQVTCHMTRLSMHERVCTRMPPPSRFTQVRARSSGPVMSAIVNAPGMSASGLAKVRHALKSHFHSRNADATHNLASCDPLPDSQATCRV